MFENLTNVIDLGNKVINLCDKPVYYGLDVSVVCECIIITFRAPWSTSQITYNVYTDGMYDIEDEDGNVIDLELTHTNINSHAMMICGYLKSAVKTEPCTYGLPGNYR